MERLSLADTWLRELPTDIIHYVLAPYIQDKYVIPCTLLPEIRHRPREFIQVVGEEILFRDHYGHIIDRMSQAVDFILQPTYMTRAGPGEYYAYNAADHTIYYLTRGGVYPTNITIAPIVGLCAHKYGLFVWSDTKLYYYDHHEQLVHTYTLNHRFHYLNAYSNGVVFAYQHQLIYYHVNGTRRKFKMARHHIILAVHEDTYLLFRDHLSVSLLWLQSMRDDMDICHYGDVFSINEEGSIFVYSEAACTVHQVLNVV